MCIQLIRIDNNPQTNIDGSNNWYAQRTQIPQPFSLLLSFLNL